MISGVCIPRSNLLIGDTAFDKVLYFTACSKHANTARSAQHVDHVHLVGGVICKTCRSSRLLNVARVTHARIIQAGWDSRIQRFLDQRLLNVIAGETRLHREAPASLAYRTTANTDRDMQINVALTCHFTASCHACRRQHRASVVLNAGKVLDVKAVRIVFQQVLCRSGAAHQGFLHG